MKTFKVNSNSWHYRLATVYGNMLHSNIYFDGTDICTYTRSVFFGMILALMLVVMSSVLLAPVVHVGAWVVACISQLELLQPINGGLFVIGAIIIVALGFQTIKEKMIENKLLSGVKIIKEPGFIKQAYDSFKNKYCVKVEVSKTGDKK